MLSVAVIGGSGYTGAELLRLVAGHPDLEVVLATADTLAGESVGATYPNLAAAYPRMCFEPYDPVSAGGADLVFCCLPHGASQSLLPELRDDVRWIVDLAADFRLSDPALYAEWYGEAHSAPASIADFAYGLPELFRDRIRGATAVAAPGCYPTTATLALAPLAAGRLVELSSIIVDAASGASGAGRAPKPNTTFCAVDEDFTAYSLLRHRHTPEIEQNIAAVAGARPGDARVLFTPHLAPMSRGILATCYARPTASTSTANLLDWYHDFYSGEPFVVVGDASPSTKATLGSNACHVTVRFDERTGLVVALAALDNLVKGASGQALQCANILAGFEESAGLSTIGLYP